MPEQRVSNLIRLGEHLRTSQSSLQPILKEAAWQNNWFTPPFLDHALNVIVQNYLSAEALIPFSESISDYKRQSSEKLVGLTLPGNIPLSGFHDVLCGYLMGCRMAIRLSERDRVLLPYLTDFLISLNPDNAKFFHYTEQLKGCDAYIATGSDNSARYFHYYFSRYPHIIRKNRNSSAILDGTETKEELEKLADDVFLYFGLGCRSISQIWVPVNYDFIPLLQAFRKYDYLQDHYKYRNNLDYQLAILLLNRQPYLSTESLLMVEHKDMRSPVSVLHYAFYEQIQDVLDQLNFEHIQTLCGKEFLPFGESQKPRINDFADGVNTLDFFGNLA